MLFHFGMVCVCFLLTKNNTFSKHCQLISNYMAGANGSSLGHTRWKKTGVQALNGLIVFSWYFKRNGGCEMELSQPCSLGCSWFSSGSQTEGHNNKAVGYSSCTGDEANTSEVWECVCVLPSIHIRWLCLDWILESWYVQKKCNATVSQHIYRGLSIYNFKVNTV